MGSQTIRQDVNNTVSNPFNLTGNVDTNLALNRKICLLIQHKYSRSGKDWDWKRNCPGLLFNPDQTSPPQPPASINAGMGAGAWSNGLKTHLSLSHSCFCISGCTQRSAHWNFSFWASDFQSDKQYVKVERKLLTERISVFDHKSK